ncbi:MAG: hypothetical protein ACHQ0Y_04670 [Thermodesulfovibrionales bacterium]
MLTCLLAFAGSAGAAMGGGMMGGITTTAMMGGGMNMTNTGGFGMMNGMAGSPVVGDDGTAYLVSYNPTVSPGSIPTSNSFQSTVSAITPSGQINTITLKGIVSRPVVSGNVLVATASLPDPSNYNVVGSLGTGSTGQSVLYAITVPITPSTVPIAVTMDGEFASVPVMTTDKVYVTTTDFGIAMMQGNTTFGGMYGNFNFNTGTAKSYLYIVNFDGSLAAKIPLQ